MLAVLRRCAWVASVLSTAGALACNPADAKRGAAEEGDEALAIPVVVEPVGRGSLESTLQASSTVEAERMVMVHAEATGRIEKLAVEEGQTVREGQVLARIRADAQAAGLDRAATNLAEAQRDFEAVERLYEKHVASKDELDAARLALESATLDVRDRRRDVRNATVTAPLGGTVTERLVTEGAFVSAGQQLLTITDFDSLVARVYVPEKELDRIAAGQVATVVGKAARGRRGVGVVERIAPVVDAATGTIKVTVALPRALSGEAGFLPGMYTEVTLVTAEHEGVLVVPTRALLREDDRPAVFVARGDRAERREVELGAQAGDRAEVRGGLAEGDAVIVSGQAGLKDGARIRRVDPIGEDP